MMTHYYYLASDQRLEEGLASLDFAKTEAELMLGFDYPVQREIMNGVEKQWELQELLQYIRNHTARYETCTVQIAHLVNPVQLKVEHKSTLLRHDLIEPQQLRLAVGHLLTIIKE